MQRSSACLPTQVITSLKARRLSLISSCTLQSPCTYVMVPNYRCKNPFLLSSRRPMRTMCMAHPWCIAAESSGPQMFLPNHFSKAGFAGDAAKTLSHSLPGSESLLSPPGRKKGFNRSGPVEKKKISHWWIWPETQFLIQLWEVSFECMLLKGNHWEGEKQGLT